MISILKDHELVLNKTLSESDELRNLGETLYTIFDVMQKHIRKIGPDENVLDFMKPTFENILSERIPEEITTSMRDDALFVPNVTMENQQPTSSQGTQAK